VSPGLAFRHDPYGLALALGLGTKRGQSLHHHLQTQTGENNAIDPQIYTAGFRGSIDNSVTKYHHHVDAIVKINIVPIVVAPSRKQRRGIHFNMYKSA